MQDELSAVKRKHLGNIKKFVASAKDQQAQLRAALAASPELFTKPRTVVFHGIKVGYAKGKGKVVMDDEAKVIARIRAQLPADQVELLVRIEESVHKPAVYDLTAADLKRLGIQIVGDGDGIVIKDTTSDVDELVELLLKDTSEDGE